MGAAYDENDKVDIDEKEDSPEDDGGISMRVGAYNEDGEVNIEEEIEGKLYYLRYSKSDIFIGQLINHDQETRVHDK